MPVNTVNESCALTLEICRNHKRVYLFSFFKPLQFGMEADDESLSNPLKNHLQLLFVCEFVGFPSSKFKSEVFQDVWKVALGKRYGGFLRRICRPISVD